MKNKRNIFIAIISIVTSQLAFAGSATWNMTPSSGDWANPANWTPGTVPNSPTDIATFAASSQTNVQVRYIIEVDSVVFQPGASPFTLSEQLPSNHNPTLSFYGAGVVNNSGIIQNFVLEKTEAFTPIKFMKFNNSAAAGVLTSFIIGGANTLYFYDTSSAASGNFVVDGNDSSTGGSISFADHATADNATIVANSVPNRAGGVGFSGHATAGYATITANDVASGPGATIGFGDEASADHATLIANGTIGSHTSGSSIGFGRSTTAAQATIIVNGNSAKKDGEAPDFTAAHCSFQNRDGGTARVELFGDGYMDISYSPVGLAIGSLEGDGIVYLGADPLSIGTNNLSTTFSGQIHDLGQNGGRGGSITKVGTGTLILNGASDYTGNTTILDGFLRVDNRTGSAIGTGVLQVSAGTLGGGGIISGNVTVGTGSGAGAFIAPGSGSTTLTIQTAVTFKADGTYIWRVRSGAKSDRLVANGITIESGAQITGLGRARLTTGTVFTAINNTSANPISGTFANLPDGGTLAIGNNTFQANYEGGDGNDLTLTVVP